MHSVSLAQKRKICCSISFYGQVKQFWFTQETIRDQTLFVQTHAFQLIVKAKLSARQHQLLSSGLMDDLKVPV